MIVFTESEMNKFNYKDWVSYFADNDTKRLKIDFSQENELSQKELVFPSIQAFQFN